MMRTLGLLSLSLAFAVATWLAGWWAVPVLGLIWGYLNGGARWVGLRAAAAAAAGWGLLLIWTASAGPLGAVAAKAGAVMGFPPIVLYMVTPLFAALAAGSTAGFFASLSPRRDTASPIAG